MSAESSSSSSNAPKFNISYEVQAGHTGVGPFGTKGRHIIVKDHEDREIRLFARAIEELDVKEINKKEYGIALPQGADGEEHHKVEYHPVKLKDSDGKEKVFLVAHERVVDAFKPYSKEKNAKEPENPPPGALIQFLKQHAASNWEIERAIKAGKGEVDQIEATSSSGTSSTSRAERALQELEGDVVSYTSQSLGMTSGHAKQIREVVSKYKESDEWKEYMAKPEGERGEAFRIPSGVPLHFNGKKGVASPFGLLIGKGEVPGEPDVEISIKGKLEGKRGVFFRKRQSYHLRKKGADKSVKLTMDVSTGKFRAQISIDIGARARFFAWCSDKSAGELTPAEVQSVARYQEELFNLVLNGVENQDKYSGLESVKKKTTFAAKATKPKKEAKRSEEGKKIRKEGDLVFTYTMPLALGDLTSSELYRAVRGTTSVSSISPELSATLKSTGGTVSTLHADNKVHRDLKVDNLFAFETSKEGDFAVKVMDYDYCCEVKDDGLPKTVDAEGRPVAPPPIRGTPFILDPELLYLYFLDMVPEINIAYASAPEANRVPAGQMINNSLAKFNFKHADVYSLGCTWYELLMADESKGDSYGQTPYAKAADNVLEKVEELRNACVKAGRRPTRKDLDWIRGQINSLKGLSKPYMLTARQNLSNKCPSELASLIVDMMNPDPKLRPPMEQVLEKLKKVPGYQP